VKVTAEHSEAHCERSRQSVKEGFLFYRIKLQRPDVSMRNVQVAAAIESNTADTVEPIEDDAPVATGEAAHPVVFELFVELAFLV
jgi:hypothetical protein